MFKFNNQYYFIRPKKVTKKEVIFFIYNEIGEVIGDSSRQLGIDIFKSEADVVAFNEAIDNAVTEAAIKLVFKKEFNIFIDDWKTLELNADEIIAKLESKWLFDLGFIKSILV